MTEYGQILGRSWSDRWLLVEATITCALVRIGLQVLSFRCLRYWLIHLADRAAGAGNRVDTTDVRWAVRVATAVLPGETTCLEDALTVTAICRRYGLPAALRLGVATEPDGFAAHAWVDVDGELVGETAPRYTTLPIDEEV